MKHINSAQNWLILAELMDRSTRKAGRTKKAHQLESGSYHESFSRLDGIISRPRPIIIPKVVTLKTLSDVRTLSQCSAAKRLPPP
jgi:hypothetical protein